MSFLVYFAVMIVAAASAIFGLDLLTAPLPSKPTTQVASTATPSRVAQHEADKKQVAAETARTDDRALTPVFRAAPGGSKEVRMVYPPTNETTGAAPRDEDKRAVPQPDQTAQAAQAQQVAARVEQANAQEKQPQTDSIKQPEQTPQATAAPAPQQTAAVEPQPQQTSRPVAPVVAQAKAETPAKESDERAATPKIQPAMQKTANHCDVSACAAAYSSFRASDCTYQPFSGSRRVCEAPPAQKTAERANARTPDARGSWQTRKDAELREVAQRVREMTSARGEQTRGDIDDYDDDAPMAGRRVIVIDRGYGWR